MAGVTLSAVYKSFGKNEVIHGISCDIQDGEFIVILGPSGCGKSTLLRMVAGLEKITDGQVAIDGCVVNEREPADRDVAMVFQNYALYPHMSVFNNMAYGLRIRRMPKAEIEERVHNAARILELTDLLGRKPRQLSGGQRQRVAMGRCIVREPKVFLFDEPLSNLDAKLRVQMRLEIRKLHEDLNITSIYVTHDQVEAMTLGDRLIVMDEGAAAQIGSPLDVYERTATRFVPDNTPTASAGRDVILGIRPEHFELAEQGMEFTVNHVEILGADPLVYGHFGRRKIDLTLRLPDIHYFAKDTCLSLSAAPHKLHLFDPHTHQRLVH